MRVLRSHFHGPVLDVEDTHQVLKELALRFGTNATASVDLVVDEKLKKATGVDVAELARYAKNWPDDV